jgi:hypothetical protein
MKIMRGTLCFRFTKVFCVFALILSLKFEFGVCFSSPSRQISENNGSKYIIDNPKFKWDGFRLNIDYQISASIEDEIITYAIVSGKDCEGGIISDTEIESSLIELSDKSVRLSLLLNPNTIDGASYVTNHQNFATVGVCARLWINRDSTSPGIMAENISASRNDFLMIQADLEELFGITDVLDDMSRKWGVDIYQCDDRNQQIRSPIPTLRNGEKLRLCFKPTTTTLDDGIYLSFIKSFQFARDDVIQKAVKNYGTDEATSVDCKPGSDLCVVESVLSNRFFHSPGEVTAEGLVFLQYDREDKRKKRSLSSIKVNLRPSINERSLYDYEKGEIVGGKAVEYFVTIKPMNKVNGAEAFPCDSDNTRIEKETLNEGDHINLCMQPDEEARNAGVYINSIESLSFGRANDDKIQLVVDSYGRVVNETRTQISCESGMSKCSVNSTLEDWFFDDHTRIVVTGYVVLQFGAQSQRRRVQLSNSDLGYAGRAQVNAYFDTTQRIIIEEKNPLRTWLEGLFDQYDLSETHLTIIYIVVAVLFALLCLCCCACCLFICYMRRERRVKSMSNRPISIQIHDHSNSIEIPTGSNTRDDYSSSFVPDSSSFAAQKVDVENSIPEDPSTITEDLTSSPISRKSISEKSVPQKKDTFQKKKKKKKRKSSKVKKASDRNEFDENYASTTEFTNAGSSRRSSGLAKGVVPGEIDVCFHADEHPGTEAFVAAVQQTLVNLGPVPYSPAVYRKIKRQLSDRRFYLCDQDSDDKRGEDDDDDADKQYEWRPASKRELIDVFYKYYEEEKSQISAQSLT